MRKSRRTCWSWRAHIVATEEGPLRAREVRGPVRGCAQGAAEEEAGRREDRAPTARGRRRRSSISWMRCAGASKAERGGDARKAEQPKPKAGSQRRRATKSGRTGTPEESELTETSFPAREAELRSRAGCCAPVLPGAKLHKQPAAVVDDAIVDIVHEPARAALIAIAAHLRAHPFAVDQVMVVPPAPGHLSPPMRG